MDPQLTLYHLERCPYCWMVRRAAGRLGIDLRLVDINDDPSARRLLQAARGRTTVPVLLIDDADGQRLLPESRDIIAYLERLAAARRSVA